MHKYFIKTPWVVKKIFPNYIWTLPTDEKIVYLTFDDGPHPAITRWVLNQLEQYNAEASFFCIGNNVEKFPEVYKEILENNHVVGNHTHHHLNGWETEDEKYLNDIARASQIIKSNLFRPPYGRIKNKQAKKVADAMQTRASKIIMWDVLSADFDSSISPEECLNNVLENFSAGSIIVFHDSEKAFNNLKYALPKTLEFLQRGEFQCKRIEL